MEYTGEQLHPNWRALATVHIPLKRFIKEGTNETLQGTRDNCRNKYNISGIKGQEIKEFYEELINKEKEEKTKKQSEKRSINRNKEMVDKSKLHKQKQTFEVRNYFRYAMENRVEELENMDFEAQNINVCDNYGWSALMMAVCENAYEAAEYLLTIGVDKNLKDKKGQTAKDLAQKKNNFKIIELLEHSVSNELEVDKLSKKGLELPEPFYCELCQQCFRETSKRQHQTSTIHQFNMKSTLPANSLQKFNISTRNRGLQLMVKQGWDKESGLGPSQSGRLYPVKTVIRKQRTGLGIEQQPARVTHFETFDPKAVKRHSSDYYKKKSRNRNDIRLEKIREWKRDKRLRNELN